MKTDNLKQVMETACAQGIVIPAFNIAYLPMAKAVCDGLAKTNAFGMLEVARPDVEKFGAKSFTAVAAEYRQWADPGIVTLHLDHIPVIDEDHLPVDWRSLIQEGISAGVPLVLHGGSGIQKSYVLEAVKNGITKINIGTEIRQAYEQAMAKTNNDVKSGQAAVTEKVKELVIDGYGIKGSASLIVK